MDRYVCPACPKLVAVRPSGELYPHGPGCPGTGHRLLPGGPSAHGGADTAWRQPRLRFQRVQTMRATGKLL